MEPWTGTEEGLVAHAILSLLYYGGGFLLMVGLVALGIKLMFGGDVSPKKEDPPPKEDH